MDKQLVINQQPVQNVPEGQALSTEQLKAIKGGANPWLDVQQDE